MKKLLLTLSSCAVLFGAVLPLSAQAQRQTVKGTVLDRDGSPIIGATIFEKGTQNATVTDIDGNYTLNVADKAVLSISYVGYKTLEVDARSQKNKAGKGGAIYLDEESNGIDEVVVIGYGTSRKKDITGSVASVKAEDLNSVSSSSVTQMLQGKVTGMSAIQSSAQPGAGISITIRGAASPSGSNAPLYVVDGVPLQNNSTADPGITAGFDLKTGVDRDPLNSINPNDIESIEVLKDASAAAIYGASAANGVILITTKAGKAGKPKVEWRSVVTTQIQKDYPEVLGARDFREQTNFWTKEYYLYKNSMGVYGNNAIDLSGYTPVFADVDAYSAETDWMDEVTRNGYVIDQNLSVNGGTDKTKYFFSYNYYKNQGLLKNSDMRRHSLRLNLDQTFSARVKAGVKMSYSNNTLHSTSVGAEGRGDNMLLNALRYAPDIAIKDSEGNYTKSYNKLYNNPVAYLDVEDKTETDRVMIAPTIEIKLMDGLKLNGVGGYDLQKSTRSYYLPTTAQNTSVPEGQASLGQAKVVNLSGEAFLNYDKTFAGKHHVSAVLGAGYYWTEADNFRLGAYSFFTDAFKYNNVGIASDKEKSSYTSSKSERTKLSQFVRLNYSFMDKYIVTLTARRDGSSYFSENHKWGFFPSASVAWRMSEESFLKDIKPLSNLKLRLGYGATGNENVLGTNSQALYKSGYNYLIGSTLHTGLALTQVENPNLKWETDYTLNIGIDYGFLNQRINGSIEYFHRGVKDLLDYQQLPANNAVGRMAANIGETKSQGFELSVNSQNIKTPGFTWETGLNISYFKASWVKRNPEVSLADYIGVTDDIDAIYGWKTDGIIKSKEDIPSYMPNAYVGNVKYVDLNDDGVLDSKDVVKLGNSTPRWMIGLNNTFSYKNFDLNFYLYSAAGYKKSRGQVPDASVIGNQSTAPGNTYATIMTDVWNSQRGNGFLPGVATNPYDASNPSGNSDFYLMDGSYLKLKSITLGYTMPRNIFAGSHFIQGVRFFIDAQNVATWTSYEGFDPELSVNNPYPQALSLSFGFNVTF